MSPVPYVIFVQAVDRPIRRLILKRGRQADNYFPYCAEVGCGVWDTLCGIKGALYEPVGMWLPDNLRPADTSVYAQGVEVPLDYDGPIPAGFEVLPLPPCKMLVFQGPPYRDEDFGDAITTLRREMEAYDPGLHGYAWDDAAAPRIQLEPRGGRGYIEGRPVRMIVR